MKRINGYLTDLTQLLSRLSVTKVHAYVILLTVAFLFILPILLANVDYIDDNARRIYGYYTWMGLGRFMTELLMHVVTMSGDYLVYVGSQLQIASIPLLAFGGWIFATAFTKSKTVSVIHLLGGIMLIVNPFILANISFRFDSLSMVLAYVLAICAGVIVMTRHDMRRWSIVFLLLLISISFYQSMITMFLVITVTLSVYHYIVESNPLIFRQVFFGFLAFIASCITYFCLLKLLHFSSIDGGMRGGLIGFNKQGLFELYHNLLASTKPLQLFLSTSIGKVIVFVGLTFLMISLVAAVIKRYKGYKWYISSGIALSPFLIVIAIMGPFLLLSSPLIFQVRTLASSIGLLLLITVIALALMKLKNRWGLLGLTVSIFLVLYSFNFSYIYGTALAQQREYDQLVYDSIKDVVIRDDSIVQSSVVYVGGDSSSPVSVESQMRERPLLKKMDIAGDNSIWYLWTNLIDKNVLPNAAWYFYGSTQEEDRRQLCQSADREPRHEGKYFSIYRKNDSYYIWLTGDNNARNTFCAKKT